MVLHFIESVEKKEWDTTTKSKLFEDTISQTNGFLSNCLFKGTFLGDNKTEMIYYICLTPQYAWVYSKMFTYGFAFLLM